MIWAGENSTDEHVIEIRITMHRTQHEQRRDRDIWGRGRKLAEEAKKRHVNFKGQHYKAKHAGQYDGQGDTVNK